MLQEIDGKAFLLLNYEVIICGFMMRSSCCVAGD